MPGFALIGCGRIVHKHAEALSGQVRDAKLVAVCDAKPERAEAVGKKYGVPYFTDMHKMMQAHGNDIHAVCILTESGNHARHCLEMARYGKAIVVEKPMALKLPDADTMIAECKKAGAPLFVVKQNRFNLAIQQARRALEAGRLGKITLGTVRVRWCREQRYYDQDAWRGTWEFDGGVLANQASHHIDMLEWMLGDPESVFAYARTALADIEAEDTAVAVIRFKSGALGIVEATTATRPKDLEGSLSLLGEKGTIEVGGFAMNEIKVWNFTEPGPEDADVLKNTKEAPPNVYGFGHVAYLNHVVDTLTKGTPALVDGIEARKSLALLHAIYRSIETGKEVNIAEGMIESNLGAPSAAKAKRKA